MDKREWMEQPAGAWFELGMPNGTRHHALRLGPLLGVVNGDNNEEMLFGDLNAQTDENAPPYLNPIPYKIAHVAVGYMKAEARQFMLDYATRIKKGANDLHRQVVADSNPKNR